MFPVPHHETNRPPRAVIIGLVMLSVAALAVTVWTMFDFLHEQGIVKEIDHETSCRATGTGRGVDGELRWQFRLTILVVLNLVVTAFAVVLLWRAYGSSQESLRDVKALAADILSSIDQAVITTDSDGEVTSINRSGVELFGLVGRDLRSFARRVCRAKWIWSRFDRRPMRNRWPT